MKLSDVHKDMNRYLENDCYCPNEIYDVTGFFFKLFPADTEVIVIAKSDTHIGVVEASNDFPQAVLFEVESEDKVLNATRVDATENNIELIRRIANGNDTSGMKVDEFVSGQTAKSLDEILSLCDAIMV